jgi:aspartate 1-decarboxylase
MGRTKAIASKQPQGCVSQSLMQRIMLKCKIHRATLTGKALDYEGSIALDRRLLEAADLLAGEQVHVLNVNTGSRLLTYVIEAPGASGTVMLNGPAARLGEVGDPVVILAYGHYPEAAARRHQPKIVHVDANNVPVNGPCSRRPAKTARASPHRQTGLGFHCQPTLHNRAKTCE